MKTILNEKIGIDTTKQPIFLGEDLALQRYDRFKYKKYFDLFNEQLQAFWRPEEISLVNERNDYQNLTDNEKFIFTSNLKYQTLLDSVIARGIPTLTEHVSIPEVEACFNVWQMFETIHSYAYTYIVKNVYSEPSEVFDTILEDENIMKRAESVCKDYDLLKFCQDDIQSQIYLTLVSVNVLEAIRFYVSFACSFAFAENKKMVGNADIIKLIQRDENMHLQITQNLIKTLQKEEKEGLVETTKKCEEKAVSMFAEAVEEEKAWASYLFKDGAILGLNETILHSYIEYLATVRMKAINLPPIFDVKKNPIGGWLESWTDSSLVQVAPQEHEITSYKISATENDLENMEF